MTDLKDITCDEIYVKVSLVLYAHDTILLNQYELFNEVVSKLRLNQNTNYIPPEFKCKFLLVLRSLMSKNNDITVIKKNNVYYACYNYKIDNELNSPLTINYSDYWLDKQTFNKYIIENNLEEELTYQDPESGNTIIHDILSSNNFNIVNDAIKNYQINYNLKNNDNKTPIECINHVKMSLLVINDLNNRLNLIDKRVKKIEEKNNDISIYKILKLNLKKFINNNISYLLGLVFLLFSIIIYEIFQLTFVNKYFNFLLIFIFLLFFIFYYNICLYY